MSNIVKYSLEGDTNAEEVTGRVKKSVSTLEKNIEGVQNKFKSFGKDLFLSFLGPMALFSGAMALIGKMIGENEKRLSEANQAAIDGTNKLMSVEDRYYANKLNNEKKDKETVEEAVAAREKVTKDFLENDPRGKQMYDEAYREKFFGHPFKKTKRGLIYQDPDVQAKVQAVIAEDIKKNPAAANQKDPAEMLTAKQKELDAKPTTFKGPEGFSNVVGVGANPVMEAMTAQLEEQRKQTALLERMANAGFSPADGWMTAPASTAAPSRAALLRGKR